MRLMILLSACAGVGMGLTDMSRADVVTDWNTEILTSIQSTAAAPPRAARAMAMMHAAVYDAVNSVERTHSAYLVDTVAASGTDKQAAAIMAAHTVMSSLFGATRQVQIDALRDSQLAMIPNGAGKSAGMTLGTNVGSAMLASRSADGSTAVSSYTPVGGPGHWRIGPDNMSPPALPQWGGVTPFAMSTQSQFRIGAFPAMNSAEYDAAVNEVRELGRATSMTRTAEQTDIARAWAFGGGTITPPGVWNRIAQDTAADHGNDLSQNARMFAMLNVALADAAIAAWDVKYLYDCWRPIHAIREADTVPGSTLVDDDTWTPLLTTPNHPSYVSGHSTFSRAGATVLQNFFGTDAIDVALMGDFGIMRHLTSLDGAADEAGRSRIYGGIHFEFDNTGGQEIGFNVANWVTGNYFQAIPAPGVAGVMAMAGVLAVRRKRK